ncbi:hypothetical protein KM043_015360 [Ampulex compressa]|nr:hypothetical protein KM043_015360 [Ampulex compressa]
MQSRNQRNKCLPLVHRAYKRTGDRKCFPVGRKTAGDMCRTSVKCPWYTRPGGESVLKSARIVWEACNYGGCYVPTVMASIADGDRCPPGTVVVETRKSAAF